METKAIDYILSTICISLLLLLSILTIRALSIGSSYHVLIDLFLFLLFYGTYTAALLGLLRKFKPYPVGTIPMDSVEFTYWKLDAVLNGFRVEVFSPKPHNGSHDPFHVCRACYSSRRFPCIVETDGELFRSLTATPPSNVRIRQC